MLDCRYVAMYVVELGVCAGVMRTMQRDNCVDVRPVQAAMFVWGLDAEVPGLV